VPALFSFIFSYLLPARTSQKSDSQTKKQMGFLKTQSTRSPTPMARGCIGAKAPPLPRARGTPVKKTPIGAGVFQWGSSSSSLFKPKHAKKETPPGLGFLRSNCNIQYFFEKPMGCNANANAADEQASVQSKHARCIPTRRFHRALTCHTK